MSKRYWFLLIPLLALTLLVACAPQPAQEGANFDEIVARYKTFSLLTAQPLLMKNAGLCRAPIPGVDTYVHTADHQLINIYVNPLGLDAMAATGERSFPVGSIIVKEKLADEKTISGLGLMIKREKGFNPKGGDWQYAYWENGTLYSAQDQVAQCQACHVAGIVPPAWKEKYAQWGMTLQEKARDAVYLTLPGATTP